MASARKKQDEKNLKILRELVSLPGNKHCFDCNQRGPTYVNMTIGSFVCTKCSGMLRGLTPPHRVKSISMASFTSEEVDLVKSRGNDTCRSTWLALYDQNYSDTNTSKDEQHIKDFMMDKYERKRYYHDKGLRNGTVATPPPRPSATVPVSVAVKPSLSNGSVNGSSMGNAVAVGDDFVADFGSADIFSASQFNNNVTGTTGATSQPSFANFDNNVIFNSANITSPPHNGFSQGGMNGSITNGFSTPGGKAPPPSEDRYAALKDLDNALKSQQQHEQQQQHHQQQQQQQQQHQQQQQQHQQQQHQQQQHHQQPHMEWGSNGSGYASPSPLYGSPSTTGSMYGSPSQGNFMTAFHQQDHSNNISNPFSVNGGSVNGARNPWAVNGTSNMNNTVVANNCFNNTATAFSSSPGSGGNGGGANPFRDSFTSTAATNGKNGFSGFNGFQHQQNMFPVNNHSSHFNKPWANPNPFTLGVSPGAGGASNNPFL